MTFPLVWTSGVANGQVIPGSEFEQLDEDHAKAINGVDGDVAAGALEFSDCDLTGTSSVDITGPITTTQDVSCANLYASQDAEVQGNLVVQGNDLQVVNDITVGVSAFIPYLFTRRILPISGGTQTIDTSTGTVLALDFTQHRDWLITLNNGAASTQPAVLATVATLVDTHADSWRKVEPKMKFTITFVAGAAQAGGIGLSTGVLPASFHGLTVADLVGPRSGAATGTGGANDWMRIELENIGTAGTPRYACSMTMGSG